MITFTRCAFMAKQACATFSQVVQKITPPIANNFLKFFFVLFATLTLNAATAWAEEVTFVAGTDVGETSVIKDGITIAMSTMSRTDNYRTYANTEMKVSSQQATITKIEVTCTASGTNSNGPGKFSLSQNSSGTYNYSGTSGTWTGEAESVSLKASAQVRMTKIVVTYTLSGSGGTPPGEGGDDPEEPGTGETGMINFNSNAVKINAASVTGNDNLGNAWTITTVGTTSYTANNAYYQVGKSSEPATSITFTTTLPSEGNITAFSAKFGGFNGTAGNVTLKVDDTSVGTGSLNATSDVTISNSSQATGKKLTVTVTGIAKGVKVYYISYTYTTSSGGGEPSTPTPSVSVSPASYTFATTNVGETATQVFEITAENTTETLSAEISNTTDYAISTIADNKITVTYQPQTAETHEATLTIKAGDEASTTVTLSGKAVAALEGVAQLPFVFNSGKADIENTAGMTQNGLDDDYNSAPKLKFNGAGDNVIIHFDSQAGEFSFLLKQNGQNAGTFTVFESANGEDYTSVWAGGDFGNAQSETIKPTLSATARYVKFEYTTKGNNTNYALGSISIAKPDLRQEASLAWNPTSVTLTQGEAFTAPKLQNTHNVSDITYETSNDEVATVTAEGKIALASAIGTATITATFDGDATYKPATATCTITVNKYIETIDGEWELVTDASKLQAGMEIIIASVADAGTVKTMGEQGNNNRSTVASTVDGDKLNPAVGTTVITLEDCQLYEGLFALKTKDGYLYAASSSSNQLKSLKGINDNACWTITITEGVATVVATYSSNRNIMRYNETSDLFSCYASGQKDIALYAKVPEHRRTTSAGRYGTICLPGNIVKCLGATLYEVAGKDGLRVVFDEVLTPEAGMPYIFLAHNAEVLFYCGDQTAAAGNYNSLYGTFSVLQDAQLDGMYMVQNNKIVKCAATGCGVAENRAYFNGTELEALRSAPAPMPGRRRITMGTESENTTTGTEDVIAPEGQTLKLIENGQLVIIRNGEKFNAQGQKL